ncbi:cytochrome P450 [Xylaria palmicola]|nr:cytochrome P450 [Xylaria palmicola]
MSSLSWVVFVAAPKILGSAMAFVLLITSLNLVRRLFSDSSLPSTLPWAGVGEQNSRMGRARANLTSFFRLKELLNEGYVKYSKNDQTYVLPYFINGPQVILPPSQIPWLLAQPDDVLSQEHVNRQFLQSEYAFFRANRVPDPVHLDVIQHQLTKRIGGFADDIVDEVRAVLEDCWGEDTEAWREVRAYDTLLLVITRMSIRVLAGTPLCRDEEFVSVCSNFIRKVALAAAAISLLPDFLKPVFGPVFVLYDYILYRRCRSFLMPIIRERLDRMKSADAEKSPWQDATQHNDFIQWSIDHALARPVANPAELEPRVIAARFAVIAFAAIQSSVITLTNAVFDIAASPGCAASLATMRGEVVRETGEAQTTAAIAAVHNNNDDDDDDDDEDDNEPAGSSSSLSSSSDPSAAAAGCWSRAALARMTHVDSALRESLRVNGFIERGVMKMVVAPGGLALPDGARVPRGVKVGVSGYSIHHDEGNYADAMRFDAFRFARGQQKGHQDGEGEREKRPPQSLVSTSDKFMGFSHGAHACPGRFFATNQLKIALGHIALLYDIEPIPERPVNQWFFGHIAPPLTETLRVRRRKTSR